MSNGKFEWPQGKRIAVPITVLLETWSDGKAAPYSVQTTSLKPGAIDHSGISWGQYGGNEGLWRIMRVLDCFNARATICPNTASAQLYPEAIRQAIKAGHEIAGHGYFQDEILAYRQPEEEQEIIHRSLQLLEEVTGLKAKGWNSPVLAWSEHTYDFLVQEGLTWHGEAKDTSMPKKIKTKSGSLIAIPTSDFADNRVLRSSPLDYFDVYRETFEYLYRFEPMAMLPIAIHCHWGGRPLMSAMLAKILEHIAAHSEVWFPTGSEIAEWMYERDFEDTSYSGRFFA